MFIYEKDIKDFFFNKLIEAGLAPESGDLQIISDIVFDYLVNIGVLNEESITYEDYED